MNTDLSPLTLVVNIIAGFFLPLVVPALTKAHAPGWLRAAVNLALTIVLGVLTSTTLNDHTDWKSVGLSIASAFVASGSAWSHIWSSTPIPDAIAAATSGVGVGPALPAPVSPDGTPDVTSLTGPVTASGGIPLTYEQKLALLPAADVLRGGYLPSPEDLRDADYAYVTAMTASTLPASLDNGAGITFGMLLNNRLGCCGPAGLLHGLQVAIHRATGKLWIPTDAQVLRFYELCAGYRPGVASTDTGVVLRAMLDWAVKAGIVESYHAASLDRVSIRSAIVEYGFVLSGYQLPTGAEPEGNAWKVPRSGKVAGSWGGHCVPEIGYTRTKTLPVSWGVEGYATDGFDADYRVEAWGVVFTAAALAGSLPALAA